MDNLAASLMRSEYVIATVGPSKYVYSGAHALVLKGYRNGQTFVRDPYNSANNGWTNLSALWSIRSREPYLQINGSPFIQIGY